MLFLRLDEIILFQRPTRWLKDKASSKGMDKFA